MQAFFGIVTSRPDTSTAIIFGLTPFGERVELEHLDGDGLEVGDEVEGDFDPSNGIVEECQPLTATGWLTRMVIELPHVSPAEARIAIESFVRAHKVKGSTQAIANVWFYGSVSKAKKAISLYGRSNTVQAIVWFIAAQAEVDLPLVLD